MNALKFVGILFLLGLWSVVFWSLVYRRRIARDLIANDGLPRPGPRQTILLLGATVIIALTALMFYLIFG